MSNFNTAADQAKNGRDINYEEMALHYAPEEYAAASSAEEALKEAEEAEENQEEIEKAIKFHAKCMVNQDGSMNIVPSKKDSKKIGNLFNHKVKGRMWNTYSPKEGIKFLPYKADAKNENKKGGYTVEVAGRHYHKDAEGNITITSRITAEESQYQLLALHQKMEEAYHFELYGEVIIASLRDADTEDEFHRLYDRDAQPFFDVFKTLGPDPYANEEDPMAMFKEVGCLAARVKAQLLHENKHPYVRSFTIDTIHTNA